MRRFPGLLLTLATILAVPADAAVTLIAKASLGGTTDLSPFSNTLENGLAQNVLGGLGSGLAYAGGNTFLALPDRGPNATTYNAAVDNTVSYISRFQTLNMALTPTAGGALPYTLTPTLTGTTLLSSVTPLIYGTGVGLGNRADGTPLGSGAPIQNSATVNYFTGRSDNYSPVGGSGNPLDARFDPESIRLSNDGKTVFISDEYGPYVRQFDRATGQLVKTFTLPANLDVANLSPVGNTEISGNTSGRTANKGMEGLSITPDGKTLVGIMQAALIQDTPADPKANGPLRIVTVDIATGTTHEYAYNLTNGSGVSEIIAINDHEFLVDERDGKGLGDGSNAKYKQIYKVDLTGAVDVTALSGNAALAAVGVTKNSTPFLDIVTALVANGVSVANIPSKIEGLAFGQDILMNGVLTHTLYVANDNDFLPAANASGPNQFFVFGFTDADLPGYVAQQLGAAVPEPASWAMMVAGFGLLGAALRRAKRITGVSFG